MNRFFLVSTLAILTLIGTSMALDRPDPTGSCGNPTYSNTDVFGTVLGTVPSANPGASNAWNGMAYAGGFIYQLKNIASPQSCHLVQVNPANGAVVNDYTLPPATFFMGATYDGSGIWAVQFYPTNAIYKFSLTGTTISSFVPTGLGGTFSARSIGWDGTNLLVGCDQPSPQATEFVKFTPAGVMVGTPIASTAAVGWYMDGEVCADAPAGNYFVVDNVGNTLKQLAIGVGVTLQATAASPAASPDFAEGIAYNGDDLWHNGYQSVLGVLWRIDDGYVASAPALVVTITPNGPTTVPSTGGVIPFTFTILNNGPAQPYAVWARVRNPNGTYNAPNLGPVTINTPVGVTVMRHRNLTVPGAWVAGGYYQIFYGNSSFGYPPIDADSFAFTKSVVSDNNDPFVLEAACDGELLPGEVAVSAPASYAVAASAFPNPFNPSTTIHFTLPEASKVTLNVYDMNGRVVATLVNGLRAAGENQATFDGSNLSSGVYMYTLSAGQNLITGKMALVK